VSRFASIVIVLAAAAALVPVPPSWVERWYAAGIYPPLQSAVTFVSNAARLALLDLLIALVLVLVTAATVRDAFKAGRRRIWLLRLVRRAAVWSAAFYLAFVVLWGLNYRREPLGQRLDFDAAAVTPGSAARLTSIAVDRLNALYARAHADGFGPGGAVDPVLAGAFDRTARTLSADRRFVPGRPKRSLLDWYFRRAGVSGMTDPYFLETLIAGDLLPFERPFVVAHEWAHLAGLADEGEANLAGWMTCLEGSAPHQYSAWLFMYTELSSPSPARERLAANTRLTSGPREDLRAIRERVIRHVSPRIAAAGWRVYDSYLRMNRVEAGAMSYEEVVRLALGLKVARQALDAQGRRP
jgi:hypothetical protein